MVTRVHVHLKVRDLEASRGFYQHFLGVAPAKVKPVGEFGEGLRRVGIDGIDGGAILAEAPRHLPKLDAIGETFFARWASPIRGT